MGVTDHLGCLEGTELNRSVQCLEYLQLHNTWGHHSNANVLVDFFKTTVELHHYQQWAAAKSELILGIAKLSVAVVLVQSNDCQTAAYLYSQFRHQPFQSSVQNNNMISCSFIHRGDE